MHFVRQPEIIGGVEAPKNFIATHVALVGGGLIGLFAELTGQVLDFSSESSRGPLWLALGLIALPILVLVLNKRFVRDEEKRIRNTFVVMAASLLTDATAVGLACKYGGQIGQATYAMMYPLVGIHGFAFPTYLPRWNGLADAPPIAYLVGGGVAALLLSVLILSIHATAFFAWQTFVILSIQAGLVVLAAIFKRSALRQKAALDYTRDNLDSLYRSVEQVHSVAMSQDETSFRKALHKTASILGSLVGAEYCAIGFSTQYAVEDYAIWLPYADELSEAQQEILRSNHHATIDDSLVGAVLCRELGTWEFASGDNGELVSYLLEQDLPIKQDFALALREQVLRSHRIDQIVIVPIPSIARNRHHVGYMHIVNRIEDHGQIAPAGRFPRENIYLVEQVASLLQLAFELYYKEESEEAERDDNLFLSKLITYNRLDDIFDSMLKYLNTVVGSRVASLWLATEDGFTEDISIVLRHVVVGSDKNPTDADHELWKKLTERGIYSKDECWVGKYFHEPTDNETLGIEYVHDLRDERDNVWDHVNDEIGSHRLVAIPILMEGVPSTARVWDRVLGVICLRPIKHYDLTADRETRLLNLVRLISVVVEQTRYRRRYEQIDKLNTTLAEVLPLKDLKSFYQRIVEMVKKAVDVEACTLFMLNQRTGALRLEASTAKNASTWTFIDDRPVRLSTFSINDRIGGDIYEPDEASLTGTISNLGRPALFYDVLRHRTGLSLNFMEDTKSERHQSLLGVPILDRDNSVIGVIRCINKRRARKSNNSALPQKPVFVQGDKEFLQLVTGIVTPFIQSMTEDQSRVVFFRSTSHELLSPLQALLFRINYTQRRLMLELEKDTSSGQTLRRAYRSLPSKSFHYMRNEVHFITNLVKNFRDHTFFSRNVIPSYDMSKKVALYEILNEVQDLTNHTATQDRGIKIVLTRSQGRIPLLYIDRWRIQQVIFNLVHNAVKYSTKDYHDIEIRHGVNEDSSFFVEVANWGIGVPVEEQDAIFEEFERGSNAYLADVTGSGIGLAVSRANVVLHGGTLRLTRCERVNDETYLTVFEICLPRSLLRPTLKDEKAPLH